MRKSVLVALVALLALSFLVRLDRITTPPLGEPSTLEIRTYHSLLLARAFYTDWFPGAPAWQREVAKANYEEESPIEPPILEAVTAGAYRAFGGERTWFPRLLSVVAWTIGAALLFLLARRLASDVGALVATIMFLLLPFAIQASRAAQPDPLMVTLMIGGVLALVRDDEAPSTGRFVAACTVAASASFVKPTMALFYLVPVAAALALRSRGWRGALRSGRLWSFVGLSALPTLLYYAYGVLWSDELSGHLQDKVRPHLLLTSDYWSGWAHEAAEVLGVLARATSLSALALLVVALVGVAQSVRVRRAHLLVALWAGYLAFGLFFNAHIHTHSYYSLALIPIVALSVAPAVDLVVPLLRARPLQVLGIAGLVVLVLGLAELNHHRVTRDAPGQVAEARRYEEIGALTDHSAGGVFLGGDLGLAIRYHAWMAGRFWPIEASQGLDGATAAERFASTSDADRYQPALASMEPAARWFVVTDVPELQRQPDLAAILRGRRLVRSTDRYEVYEL